MFRKIAILSLLSFCLSITANDTNKVSILNKSQQNIYLSKFECQDSLSVGTFQNCWLTLSQSGKLVKSVEVFIDGGMPSHKHGLPTAPKIVWSENQNVYLIKGLKFSMPGKWELIFKVNVENYVLKNEIKMLIEVD